MTVTYPAALPRLASLAPPRLRTRRSTARRRTQGRRAAPIGTAQRTVSRGAALSVTVERVIDPLLGSGASIPPGTRAVAVLVVLQNAGPAVYDSSATGDFSIAVSRGPVTPVFVPAGTCQTPVEDFDRYMTPGELRSGCVAFAVDARARVLSVSFSPHAAARGRLSWSARRG